MITIELLLDTISVLKQISNLKYKGSKDKLDSILQLKKQCNEFILNNLDLLKTKEGIKSAIDQDLICLSINSTVLHEKHTLKKNIKFDDQTQIALNTVLDYCGDLKLSIYVINDIENFYLCSVYLEDLIKIMYE